MTVFIECDSPNCSEMVVLQDLLDKRAADWVATRDGRHYCPDCVGDLAAAIKEACLQAGGKKMPDGKIDMSGTALAPVSRSTSEPINEALPGVHVCSKALVGLNEFRSWRLDRMSPTTYPQDVGVRCPVAAAMQPELKAMMAEGQAFRCRIGTGRFFYARTLDVAARAAIESANAPAAIADTPAEVSQ